MSVRHRPDNFSRRWMLGKYDPVLLTQRRHDALKVQLAGRPPHLDFPDCAFLAVHLVGLASNDLLDGLCAMPFVGYHYIRQFMMHTPAHLATQSPDDQRPFIPVAVDDLAFTAAYNLKPSAAHRTHARFSASYVKFPASSRSNWYWAMTNIRTYTPMVRIISGYSGTGKLGDCCASHVGRNTWGGGIISYGVNSTKSFKVKETSLWEPPSIRSDAFYIAASLG